ncbi:MAG: hypothetical protein AAF614_11550 [Chloroflexota bacterium]
MEENENREQGIEQQIGQTLASSVGGIQEAVRELKGIFVELGLEPKEGMSLARYEGEVNGRSIDISVGYRTRNRYKTSSISRRHFEGLIMTIAMKTEIKATLHFLPPSAQWLMRLIQPWRGNKHVEGLGVPYNDLRVWAYDEAWARDYLGKTAVQEALSPFIFEKDPETAQKSGVVYTILNSVAPSLYPSNKAASYTVAFGYETCSLIISNPPTPFTIEAFREWIEQLNRIVSLAEQYPPTNEATLSWLGQQSETFQVWAVAGAVLFIPTALLGCCCIAGLVTVLIAQSLAG